MLCKVIIWLRTHTCNLCLFILLRFHFIGPILSGVKIDNYLCVLCRIDYCIAAHTRLHILKSPGSFHLYCVGVLLCAVTTLSVNWDDRCVTVVPADTTQNELPDTASLTIFSRL